jgi:hypothetical protein
MTPSPSRFSAGYGERLITPPMGVDLSGYGFYLDRKAGAVLDDLKVRAVHLADGRQAVFRNRRRAPLA